jgi:hypothetical protein
MLTVSEEKNPLETKLNGQVSWCIAPEQVTRGILELEDL